MVNLYGTLSPLIDKIKEIIDSDDFDMDMLPPASENSIFEFESKNNIVIPEMYKLFLKYTDGCRLLSGTVQLYGVSNKPYIETNFDGVKKGYYVIGTTGWGDQVCFIEGEEKIFLYGESLIEYSDFKEFLEYVITELGEVK